ARYRDAGITLFFDLTEAGEHDLRPYAPLLPQAYGDAAHTVVHRRFPIPDKGIPDAAQMAAIQESLAHYLAQGEVVYVHCWGGIGRTGTVIGCRLVEQGMGGDAALAQIAQWRKGTPDGHRSSPETDEQWRMVQTWQPVHKSGFDN
ncbi:MAG: hypothetical protein KDD84_23070, partial [Caldilineaceae bacterium]|nr:hypothetical protein [Caldilineaceae bacterium]